MNKDNKYFAFISYKREDEEWAMWFHHELENYHLPATLNGRTDLPKEFRPVFRDIDELKAGNLPEQIYNALATSKFLIVICSPNAAKSEWVNKEIMDFIEIGKSKGIDNVRNIFPFIVDGHPHARNQAEECFPMALLNLPGCQERIGGNINEGHRDWTGDVKESGADKAFVKVLAGMLPNVEFGDLWNRYEQDKAKEERLKREERERFLRVQSRFVAEKVIDIVHDSPLAQCLALEVLPKDVEDPDRPLTFEAEHALRQASSRHNVFMRGEASDINVKDFAFSCDGKLLASISGWTIKIWSAETGRKIKTIGFEYPNIGECIAFYPNDTIIIVAFDNGTLNAWDFETEELLWQLDLNTIFDSEYSINPCSMAIFPNGSLLAVSSSNGKIYIINLVEENTLSVDFGSSAYCLEFSQNGRYMVAVSLDGFMLWDLENGAEVKKEFDKEAKELIENAFAAISPDGKRLAIAACTPLITKILIFDLESGTQIQTIKKEHNEIVDPGQRDGVVVSVSFSNDNNHVYTVADDGVIMKWAIETGEMIECVYPVSAVKVNKAIFTSDSGFVGMVVDQNNIIIRSIQPAYIERRIITGEKKLGCVSFSIDGKHILTSNAEQEKGGLEIWDIQTGDILCKLIGHTDSVWSATYSPDGKMIASASFDGTVRIWNALTGHEIKSFHFHASDDNYGDRISHVAFCSSGERIVMTAYCGEVVIWDFLSGEKVSSWKHKSSIVFGAAISPDEKRIAFTTIYTHQGICICNIESGEIINTLKGHTHAVNSVAFSPDGQEIVSGGDDKTIICWNTKDGSVIWQNTGLNGSVCSLAYSHDGRYIVASEWDIDEQIVVYEARSGTKIVVLQDGIEAANCAVFSPDDQRIVSAGTSGTVRIWSFPPLNTLIDQTRKRFKDRPLTPEERHQYYLE